MLCVRGPRGTLPNTSILAPQFGLMIASHLNRDQDEVQNDANDYVTWYVTPIDQEATPASDAPDNAHVEIHAHVVALGLDSLLKVYPSLSRPDPRVHFAVFAGFKQDIGEQQIVPACELVDGTSNVIMALPSVLANAWTNASEASRMLGDRVVPTGTRSSGVIPGAGHGVNVGVVNELTAEVK